MSVGFSLPPSNPTKKFHIFAAVSLQPGKIIQNYRLLRFLGDGGMGSVWLAQHTQFDRQVAVKSLHGQLLRNQGIRERFKNEAATLAHLQHERIVALHDYIEDDEGAYLVMEFVDGLPLDEYIRDVSGPIPDAQLRELFGQILEGFVYAHSKRVVHRDIKPGNFLITPQGEVKILDFGIAKILGDGDRKLTKTGTNMGTVLYMSPEQVKGQVVDQRSDIYALGVTLFQMATGRNPYSADMTEFYVYDQIVNHPLPPAHEFYPGASPEVEALIAKATAKDPADRFQDVAAFLHALRNADVSNSADMSVSESVRVEEERLEAGQVSVEAAIPVSNRAQEVEATAPVVAAPSVAMVDTAPRQVLPPRAPKRKRRVWVWLLLLLLVGGGIAGGVFGLPYLQSGPQKLYVVPEDLHLWNDDKVGSGDLGAIPFGTEVTVIGKGDRGWQKIQWNARQGYVNGYYLVPFEEFQIIKHSMDVGMKRWLDKSYLRISLAQYFHNEGLKASLPPKTFELVYGQKMEGKEVWSANAKSFESEYNNVIRGMSLQVDQYAKDGRQPDNVVILQSKGKDNAHRKMVVFKHEKRGESYESKVLATVDISDYPNHEIRIATAPKLNAYNFENKASILQEARSSKQSILMANPRDESTAILFHMDDRGNLEQIALTR